MRNAGGATRSYLFVEDVAEAFDCVLHKGVTGEVYNIGTQKERTVLDVANDIAKIFNLPTSKITHVRDRAFNDRRYYICDNKLAGLGEYPSPACQLQAVHCVTKLEQSSCYTAHAGWTRPQVETCPVSCRAAVHDLLQAVLST